MDSEIKAQWVAALRSGEYQQGGGSLHNPENNTHCCLGVLCELAVQAGVIAAKEPQVSISLFAGRSASLPPEVVSWASVDSSDPCDHTGRSLSDMNDSDVSFIQIADLIEASDL